MRWGGQGHLPVAGSALPTLLGLLAIPLLPAWLRPAYKAADLYLPAYLLTGPLSPSPACGGLSEVDRLGTVERYFVEVKDIPRLAERIRCFIFSRTHAATHAQVSMGRFGAWVCVVHRLLLHLMFG